MTLRSYVTTTLIWYGTDVNEAFCNCAVLSCYAYETTLKDNTLILINICMSVLTWSVCHAGDADILIYEAISCHCTNLILRNTNISYTVTIMKGHVIKRCLPCGKGHPTVECMEWTYRCRSSANRQNRIVPVLHKPNHFLEIIVLCIDYHFTGVCYKGSNWPQINVA